MLSRRLKTIAALVPLGARVCDIGTDHAILPVFLSENTLVKSIIATDVREKPLKNAKKNIERSGVANIELRLCDGFSCISPDEFDTAIIAGMGGEVISGIISRAEMLKDAGKLLILQPTTSPEILRKYLCDNGFVIETEIPLTDNGKIYSVMAVRYSGRTKLYDEAYYYVGDIKPDSPDGLAYIEKQYYRFKDCADALRPISEKLNEYKAYRSLAEKIRSIRDGV